MKLKYLFSNKLWQHSSPGGWYFITLPEGLAKEIRETLKWQEEGWGRLKVLAKIDNIEWATAIWFDTKMNTYLLPIKAVIRKKGNLEIGNIIEVVIWI
jgi:hypothetical protein